MPLTQKVRNNPNATVGAGGGFLAVFIAWPGGNILGWHISAEDRAIIATAITTVALAIGRNGISGILRTVWVGKQAAEQSACRTDAALSTDGATGRVLLSIAYRMRRRAGGDVIAHRISDEEVPQ